MGVQVTVWPRGSRRTRTAGPLGVDWDGSTRRVGVPLFSQQYGKLTAATASTRYEPGFGGFDLCSWTVVPYGGYVGGLMRPGDPVQMTKGGGEVFFGEFSETEPNDDGTVTLHAKGYAYNLNDYQALFLDPVDGGDDVSYPTTQLGATTAPVSSDAARYAWQYAVYDRGMPITNVIGSTSSWGVPLGESDMAEGPLTVGDLVTAVHQADGERWAVWGRTLFVGPDATDPMWSYAAPDSVFGVADTDYATTVFVWYVSSDLCSVQPWNVATAYGAGDVVSDGGRWWQALIPTTGGSAPSEGLAWTEVPTAYRKSDFALGGATDTAGLDRFDVREVLVDYRGLGTILDSRATTLAGGLLDQVKGRFILTGGFTVGPESGFASADGGKADIAFVRAGEVLKMPGLRTDQGNLMDSDATVIGKTEWSCQVEGGEIASESLSVTPMGAVPRDLGSILQGAPLDATGMAAGNGKRAA